jgi:DNA-binding beta-propeller fold protein YncE
MKLMNWVRLGLIVLGTVIFFQTCILADNFDATTEVVGHNTNGLETPVNQLVTPVGIQVALPGVRPNALALSPDGKLLVTSGLRSQLIVVNPANGKIRQRVPLPSDDQLPASAPVSANILNPDSRDKLSLTGLAFSPDGSRIYLSNANGDIKVFSVGKDHTVAPLFSLPLPPANAPERPEPVPAGIAVSPDGKQLYVALNLSDRLAELSVDSGKVLRLWKVGVAPYDVALCGNKIYVSNWGGRQPDANSVAGPAGQGTLVRVDARSIASEGSVSVIDPKRPGSAEQMEIITGRHACALALSPDKKFLVCANAADDTVSVIDTHTDKIVENICARRNPADLFGAQPDALAFDKSGKKLFVCNGTQNAVAVFKFKPGNSKWLGLIPVGWFPGSIAHDARRAMLDVANIKDIAPKRKEVWPGKGRGLGFNTRQFYGSLSLVSVPSSRHLKEDTQTALADLRYPLLAQAKLPARPNQPARPVPERVGEPSVFQHVIYVIKENRSYDQVLGDVKAGNGDADLCIFGRRVTPNEHKFVRDFTLLDNTYCCGILSADGHEWTDTGIATDYMEREFAGWPRSYGAIDSMIYSSAGFIWNDAIKHGKSVIDFGEFTHGQTLWRNPGRNGIPRFLDCYRDFLSGSNAVVYSPELELAALRPYIATNYPGFDLNVPDVVRAALFIRALKHYETENNFPNLIILWLPNDHTSGTRFSSPTPEAQVADNDLAFGQVVAAVSHSKFWTNTCILGIEDDPQDGWDHVSGYRTTAYVISPYTKRHAVVNTQYNQTSLLRTMELMLGLPPMNQMDATATPMFDCFTNAPDFTPYTAVTNQVPLTAMNPKPRNIADPMLRKDAIVSSKLPLDQEDKCPEDLFNRIIWRSVKGSKVPYPDWAVKAADDDD